MYDRAKNDNSAMAGMIIWTTRLTVTHRAAHDLQQRFGASEIIKCVLYCVKSFLFFSTWTLGSKHVELNTSPVWHQYHYDNMHKWDMKLIPYENYRFSTMHHTAGQIFISNYYCTLFWYQLWNYVFVYDWMKLKRQFVYYTMDNWLVCACWIL